MKEMRSAAIPDRLNQYRDAGFVTMTRWAIATVCTLALAGCVQTEDVDPSWAYDAIAAAAPPQILERGMSFPLSSGTAPRLNRVDVGWVTSTQRIELTVVLEAFARNTADSLEDLVDFGEFCLRYGNLIIRDSVPADRLALVSLMAVVYRPQERDRPIRVGDLGFGFAVFNGQCTLAQPYPAALVAEVQQRALRPLGETEG